MNRKIIYLFITLVAIGVATYLIYSSRPSLEKHTSRSEYCKNVYEKSGECPENHCEIDCWCGPNNGSDMFGCAPGCCQKSCSDYSAENCPTGDCDLWKNCSGEYICHDGPSLGSLECGVMGFYSQNLDCCDGFIRRCGKENRDGTCDMEEKIENYPFPKCIPCGDGICENTGGHSENKCNCPEDCK